MRILLCLLLIACGDAPRKVLREQGRPEPVRCVVTGENQQTCKDGDGLIWTCGYNQFTDASCVNTGQTPNERP